jgi:gamma-glutamyltranspeptidase/glutathione hydrolase
MELFDWSLPYASQREPVLARQVVATSQPLAAQAGLQMLLRGGSAADAAIATAAALTVLEPCSNGIGSDAFALVAERGQVLGLNGSGRAPAAHALERLEPWRGTTQPRLGWEWVTVPGSVAAWRDLWLRCGRLPFASLIEPAITWARDGFPVAPQTAAAWARAEQRFGAAQGAAVPAEFREFHRVFLPGGKAPRPSQIVTLPEHAATLAEIARTNGDSFYRGPLANAIAAAAKADGALLSSEDLDGHRSEWVEPISIEYRGLTLHEIPPNGQGIAALMALGILQEKPLATLQPDCPDAVHLQIEAMKLSFADTHAHVADPASMRRSVTELLDQERLAGLAARVDASSAADPSHGEPRRGGTVLLVAADRDGMMVSFIQSNYEGFGSGVVVPGTGIALQNRGGCFSLDPEHPNVAGGGKRPYHTIIPGMVTKGGSPLMAFGVMGGFMQPQGHVQVLSRLADFRQNPQAALDAPRWRVEQGRKVAIEPGFEPALYEELRRRGHEIELAERRSVAFGGAQAVLRLENGAYLGASDPRRDGMAVGF